MDILLYAGIAALGGSYGRACRIKEDCNTNYIKLKYCVDNNKYNLNNCRNELKNFIESYETSLNISSEAKTT